ncbi:glycosyltransferase [Magnetococcus sp. PR-3]|uniref:glycosyltransferase n=1 Tax=Magnetococcus sp. PR-3 TaxID=3120355 RepID=UPI002FCE0334
MSRIVIISGFQVINNPRVAKEAAALAQAGHDVEVLGSILDLSSAQRTEALLHGARWRYTPMVDLVQGSWLDRARWLRARLRVKGAQWLHRFLGWESSAQLGYFTRRLFHYAHTRQADLYIVHLEPALWVGVKLMQAGHKVAMDVEDWYSEDLLPADRAKRPMGKMKAYEAKLLQDAAYVTTTSQALSQALARAYQATPPAVVYNTFPWAERDLLCGEVLDRQDPELVSLVWFSQTIGPGRGLEQLMQALHAVTQPFEIHLRGNPRPGMEAQLRALAPDFMQPHIYFHGVVPQAQLLARLAEHDIGFCGELSDCPSRDLTITNKSMEYLRSGLALVASDTAGQKELAEAVPQACFVYEQNQPTSLANVLNMLLPSQKRLQQAKQASLQAAMATYSWEQDAKVLLEQVQKALSQPSAQG